MNSARAITMVVIATRATSTTNIAALATDYNHRTFIHCNANAWFRVFSGHEDFGFAKNHHSTLYCSAANVQRVEREQFDR